MTVSALSVCVRARMYLIYVNILDEQKKKSIDEMFGDESDSDEDTFRSCKVHSENNKAGFEVC